MIQTLMMAVVAMLVVSSVTNFVASVLWGRGLLVRAVSFLPILFAVMQAMNATRGPPPTPWLPTLVLNILWVLTGAFTTWAHYRFGQERLKFEASRVRLEQERQKLEAVQRGLRDT